MRRASTLSLALALALAFSLTHAAAADDNGRAAAEKFLAAGARMFDAKDAKGLAATYTEDAVVTAYSRDSNTSDLKTETRHGHADIEKVYIDVFNGDATFHAKNTIEYVRQPSPDVLIVTGTFEPDSQVSNPIKVPFVQVRHKKGDAWKIASMQIFVELDK